MVVCKLKNFGNCLPGRHLLSTWVLSLWVHFVLLLGAMDLNRHEHPVSPGIDTSREDVPIQESLAPRRIVVFHVDALQPSRLFSHVEEQPKLKAIIGTKGSWGIAFSPSFITPRQRMMSTFSGSYWSDGGVLKEASSVYFIGDPETAKSFKLSRKKLKALTWDNPTWDRYSYISNDIAVDEWVLQQTLYLLQSKSFPEINQDKVVLIIRLVGLGMSAHLEGESSLRAKEALVRILSIIDAIVTDVESTWKDNETTFVIVSDSMISPVVAWGPMISAALIPEPNPSTIDWKSPYTKRRDLDRRSIAPLLACAMKVNPPTESVSKLPADFLKEKPRMKANCARKTARQVMKLFIATANYHNKDCILNIISLWTSITPEGVENMAERIDAAYDDGDYLGVIAASKILVDRCLHGLHYYTEFKRKFCAHVLLFTVIGWMLASATWICPRLDISLSIEREGNHMNTTWYCKPQVVFDIFMTFTTIAVVIAASLDKFSFRYYTYVITPCLVWWAGLRDFHQWVKIYKSSVHPEAMSFVSVVYVMFAGITWGLISDRLSLSLLLVSTLTFSSFFSMMRTKSVRLKFWLLSSIPFIVLLHYKKKEMEGADESAQLLSAIAWILAICCVSKIASAKLGDTPILVAGILSLLAILLKKASGGPTTPYHAAWIVLIFLPLIGSPNVIMRLLQIFFSVCVPFFLLTTGSEPLSLLGLSFHATTWYLAECYSNCEDNEILNAKLEEGKEETRKFNTNDSRRVFFYLIYIVLAVSAVRITDHFIVFKGDFTADITKETVRSGVYWYAKTFAPVACMSCLVVLLWKKSNGDELALALSIIFMCSLMSFMFLLMVLGGGEDLDKLQWSVSHFFSGQFVTLVILTSLPAAYFLTIPSLLSKYIDSPYHHPTPKNPNTP